MKLFFPTMALLLLMLVAMLTFSRREASGSGAWIVYASLGDAGVNVHLMSSGSGSDTSRKLAPDSMCGAAPRWTPRGDRIVFESHCGNTEGYFMHILPGAARPQVLLSERAFASSIEWSHDGNAMLIESSVTDILLADADFNIERLLSNDHFRAQWSPDGQWIYAHPFYHDGTLDRIHVETGRVESIVAEGIGLTDLSWSPDGAHITAGMGLETGYELVVMAPNGDNLRVLTDRAFNLIVNPTWSPNGEWIAFVGIGAEDNSHIYRIRPDGGNLQRLTQQPAAIGYLQWTPDSAWLIFDAQFDGPLNIYRLRADGSQMENLTNSPQPDYTAQIAPVAGPEWHPFLLIIAAIGLLLFSLMGMGRLRP